MAASSGSTFRSAMAAQGGIGKVGARAEKTVKFTFFQLDRLEANSVGQMIGWGNSPKRVGDMTRFANAPPGRTSSMSRTRPPTKIAAIALALFAYAAPALAKTAIVTQDTPACTSWAAWRDWVRASLTTKGAALNRHCPRYIDKGTKVELIEANEGEGVASVRWRGKRWFTHEDRLGE